MKNTQRRQVGRGLSVNDNTNAGNIYLNVSSKRVTGLMSRPYLGAVGEKHTTAAGWEALSLNDNTNVGKARKAYAL